VRLSAPQANGAEAQLHFSQTPQGFAGHSPLVTSRWGSDRNRDGLIFLPSLLKIREKSFLDRD
jgi:hypothetical protein